MSRVRIERWTRELGRLVLAGPDALDRRLSMTEHDEQMEAFRQAVARKEQAAREASQHPHHDKAPDKLGHPEPAHTREQRQGGGERRGD
jgi:uncharacterized damage-inducible protein DinB